MSTIGRASASEYISIPTKRSVGSFSALRVAEATTLGRCAACKTFQRNKIGFMLNPFLFKGSVEKCATRNAKNRTAKNTSLDTSAGLGNKE